MVALQGSLLGLLEEPGPTRSAVAFERIELAQGAFVDCCRGFVGGADSLFEALLSAVPWEAERRPMYDRIVDVPRLHRFYDVREPLPNPGLDRVRTELIEHYGTTSGGPVATTGLCLYRDGNDSVAWHGDRIGRGLYADTLVAIVSLGAPRRFLLRPRGGGESLRFELGPGDLLVMGGSCQRTYEHSIPKTRRPVGPRISVQYRPVGVR